MPSISSACVMRCRALAMGKAPCLRSMLARGHSDIGIVLSAHQTRVAGESSGGDGRCRLCDSLDSRSRSRPWHCCAGIRARRGNGYRCNDTVAQEAAPLTYIAASLGTLIGADLTNLDKVRGLGAPVASIGGAGTFDGIFLTAI